MAAGARVDWRASERSPVKPALDGRTSRTGASPAKGVLRGGQLRLACSGDGHRAAGQNGDQSLLLSEAPHRIIGPDQNIVIPPMAQNVDWEVELAAYIGKRAKDVPLDEAADYVAGYTILNDISARDTH